MTLRELNRQIAAALGRAFASPLWVTAEVADIRVASGGHCYMELVEKDPHTGALLARAHAVLWAGRFVTVRQAFEDATGQPLVQPGLRLLLQVVVQMHEAYGLKLIVQDIDPTYTLGEMALRRQQILSRLTAEGMTDMQRSLLLPLLPQRVAIVSAPGAAGYGDFCRQLEANDWGARFYTHLFPAIMQGPETEASVIAALERIYRHAELFDVVVIIRGGGGTADLASFDSYDLAVHVANFPLPVLTGIGHDRDHTVLDAVAHTSVKTPTAAAALLIDRVAQQAARLDEAQRRVCDLARRRIEREQQRIARAAIAARATRSRLAALGAQLTLAAERIRLYARGRIERDAQRHIALQTTIRLVQPDLILRRGFSITRADGHAVRHPDEVAPGQVLVTQLAGGTVTTVVTASTPSAPAAE